MFKSIIRKRISFILALLLTAVMLLQLSPTALAEGAVNGVGVSAPSSPKNARQGKAVAPSGTRSVISFGKRSFLWVPASQIHRNGKAALKNTVFLYKPIGGAVRART
jgi:hypothetical protein